MIRLTPPQRHRAVKIIRDCFYDYCDKPVTVISDEIQTRFSICFDVNFCVDDNYYEAFDRYTDLSETYTELAYHHMLYKKGTRAATGSGVFVSQDILTEIAKNETIRTINQRTTKGLCERR